MTLRANSTGFGATIFIRIAVGLIFFTQGILKYIDPKMGVERFARIGFPHPAKNLEPDLHRVPKNRRQPLLAAHR
jgi:uncharacterized membrane protein YphA (DoxX/SURF4 family)